MSKPTRTIPAVHGHSRPAAWAQALFAGSVLFAGVSIWLLATL